MVKMNDAKLNSMTYFSTKIKGSETKKVTKTLSYVTTLRNTNTAVPGGCL
jgi:hypothetical protein